MNTAKQLGDRGELLAVEALQRYGYTILDRNWRGEGGEIDIIARDEDLLVFVEVKYRSGEDFGHPAEAVTESKSKRIMQTALQYLSLQELDDLGWRVDIVAILANQEGKVVRIDLLKDALHVSD